MISRLVHHSENHISLLPLILLIAALLDIVCLRAVFCLSNCSCSWLERLVDFNAAKLPEFLPAKTFV